MKILAILGSGQIAIEYSKILKSVGQKDIMDHHLLVNQNLG